jgi:excisionase family DNA binding protein
VPSLPRSRSGLDAANPSQRVAGEGTGLSRARLRPPPAGVAAVSDQLLDAGQVAELLNVPVGWVREHTRSGALPHVELGRYRRYRREAALAWVEGHS